MMFRRTQQLKKMPRAVAGQKVLIHDSISQAARKPQ